VRPAAPAAAVIVLTGKVLSAYRFQAFPPLRYIPIKFLLALAAAEKMKLPIQIAESLRVALAQLPSTDRVYISVDSTGAG
jgi:hypothetical protein